MSSALLHDYSYVLGFIIMLVGAVIVYSAFGARPADETPAAAAKPAESSPSCSD
jgi:hypothetical protein